MQTVQLCGRDLLGPQEALHQLVGRAVEDAVQEAGGAVLASTVVFCAVWTVLLLRIHRAPRTAAAAPPVAVVEAEAPGSL